MGPALKQNLQVGVVQAPMSPGSTKEAVNRSRICVLNGENACSDQLDYASKRRMGPKVKNKRAPRYFFPYKCVNKLDDVRLHPPRGGQYLETEAQVFEVCFKTKLFMRGSICGGGER